MNVGKSKELINLMKSGDRAVIKELLGYKDDCAGGIMTTEYIALNANLPIEDAIKKIKEILNRRCRWSKNIIFSIYFNNWYYLWYSICNYA